MPGIVEPARYQNGQSVKGMEGLVYDATAGGFVNANSINPATGKPYGQGGASIATQAMGTDPNRTVNQGFQWNGREWAKNQGPTTTTQPGGFGSVSPGAMNGGSSASASSSGGANPTFQSKLEEMWNLFKQPITPYDAPQRDPNGDTTQADNSLLAQSKERAGLRLQGGLKTLASEMARRGISGSGIQAGNTRTLVRGAMSDMAEADNAVLQRQQDRNASISDQNFAAKRQALSDYMAAQTSAQGRLASLLQYYGMAY